MVLWRGPRLLVEAPSRSSVKTATAVSIVQRHVSQWGVFNLLVYVSHTVVGYYGTKIYTTTLSPRFSSLAR